MFIIWSGLGFLVVFIGGLALAVGIGGSQAILGNTPSSAGIGLTAAALLATGGNYALSVWLARRSKPRVLVDKATGRDVILARRDSLFFVPVRYWTFLYAFLAACICAGTLADHIHH